MSAHEIDNPVEALCATLARLAVAVHRTHAQLTASDQWRRLSSRDMGIYVLPTLRAMGLDEGNLEEGWDGTDKYGINQVHALLEEYRQEFEQVVGGQMREICGAHYVPPLPFKGGYEGPIVSG